MPSWLHVGNFFFKLWATSSECTPSFVGLILPFIVWLSWPPSREECRAPLFDFEQFWARFWKVSCPPFSCACVFSFFSCRPGPLWAPFGLDLGVGSVLKRLAVIAARWKFWAVMHYFRQDFRDGYSRQVFRTSIPDRSAAPSRKAFSIMRKIMQFT